MTHPPAGPGGRLAHVEATRTGVSVDPERPMVIAHREALIYTLGKAAELEHLAMCQYLYAAFSLRQDEKEGVPPELVPALKGWRRELLRIAGQEMLHLALVQNLLASVGAAPRLARPNLPLPPAAYPAGVQIALLPFGEAALRHFAFLERPEGHDMTDAEEFAALAKARELPHDEADEIGPHLQEFETIGHLYRSIEDGLEALAARLGEDRLFIGPARAQATAEHLRWQELVPVRDLASAHAAIDTIVEQGEGARGEWREAHFGRLVRMLDEHLATIGPEHPGRTTGPALELFYDVDYLLPHRRAAWAIMEERLREIAELAVRCRDQCVPAFMPVLAKVTSSLRDQADLLGQAGEPGKLIEGS